MTRTYGGTYRGPCRSEDCEQIDFMSWLEVHHPERYPLCFHVPNEIRASAQYMQKRKKMGVKPGVADTVDTNGPVIGFFEMKRLDRTKSKVSKDQRDFLAAADARGHFTAICYGCEAAKEAYADFLSLHG